MEWAKEHINSLINGQVRLFEGWIRAVCDKPDPFLDGEETFEDFSFWKTWRAPRLIYMTPSGAAQYDPATAWTREDELKTQGLLKGLSSRFVQDLGIQLNNIAGHAHLRLAQGTGRDHVQQPESEHPHQPKSQLAHETTTVSTVMNGGPVRPSSSDQEEQCSSHWGGTGTWEAIEILFLSDERIQIRQGSNNETRNYAEFGFADRRSGKPSQAWVILRALAQGRGEIEDGRKTGQPWVKIEKRIQEIRKVLRAHFGISADPIPFVEGVGYRACFKIKCGASFDT